MPHDKNGKLVKEGDHVKIEFLVKSITGGEDYCNVSLETIIPMLPQGGFCGMSLNTAQCELVEEQCDPEPAGTYAPPATPEKTSPDEGLENSEKEKVFGASNDAEEMVDNGMGKMVPISTIVKKV